MLQLAKASSQVFTEQTNSLFVQSSSSGAFHQFLQSLQQTRWKDYFANTSCLCCLRFNEIHWEYSFWRGTRHKGLIRLATRIVELINLIVERVYMNHFGCLFTQFTSCFVHFAMWLLVFAVAGVHILTRANTIQSKWATLPQHPQRGFGSSFSFGVSHLSSA
jgi:hypothetical protein